MRLTLDDSVAETYTEYATRQGKSVEDLCAAQLKRFAKLEPGKKVLVIPVQLDGVLADRLGGLPLKDGMDLLTRMERLARITFMGLDLQLSPGQLEELAYRAQRQGKSVGALIEEIWAQLREQFFYTSGGGERALPIAPESAAAR